MANNISVKDSAGTATLVKTTDNSSVHTPHHNVDTLAAGGSVDVGATTEAEATGNGSLIAILKRIRTLLSSALSVVQSGTWTVQPGNTANTTAWKVDGSAVTQPVSVASVPSHAVTNAGTFATQATVQAAENHVGQIGTEGDVFDVTLTLDTSAYASGDVMADTQTLTNAVRVSGGRAILQSLTVIDEDDQAQAFDLLFFLANRSLGTENSAPNISDTNARDCLGFVKVATTDYIDLGGVQVACLRGLGLVLEASGSRDLYLGTIIRGAATYTASGVKLKLGLLWD